MMSKKRFDVRRLPRPFVGGIVFNPVWLLVAAKKHKIPIKKPHENNIEQNLVAIRQATLDRR